MRRITSLPDKCLLGYDQDFNTNHFFFEHDCFLKDYNFSNDKKLFIPAGNIINSWCSAFNINQRLLCITLQREQGLVSKKSINEVIIYNKTVKDKQGNTINISVNPLDWACGCGVPDNTELNAKYEGFGKQVKGAVKTYKWWYDQYSFGKQKKLVNDEVVECDNGTTFSLLCYTPHLSALELTKQLYQQYFGDFLNAA